MIRPFDGIRVLDLTHVLAGPFCAYQLALLGADVVKIEPPDDPDCVRGRGPDDALNAAGMGINYQTQGSNKRALSLDLKRPEGQAIFHRLAVRADVVIENYRSGALDALGLGYDAVSAANPRIVYCSLTGYGGTGPRGGVNAYDNVVQAASGLMARTGAKVGASVIDYASGLNAAFAVASALFQRGRTGLGQRIDCSMLETALLMMGPELAAERYAGPHASRPAEAGLGCYDTADGQLMLGAFNVRQNRRLWTALARPDFAALDSWEALWAAAEPMRQALLRIMPTRTAAAWEDLLQGLGIPAERVRTLGEAARLPQLHHRGFLAELPPALPGGYPVSVPVAAFRYADGGPAVTSAPPRHGEHSEAILAELGCSVDEIAALRSAGVV